MPFNRQAEVEKSKGYAVRPPEGEQTRRIEKAQSALSDHDLDAVIYYGTGAINPDPLRYLSGYVHPFAKSRSLLLVPRDGQPILFVNQSWHLEAARKMSWLSDVRGLPSDRQAISESISSDFAKRGLDAPSIGIFPADTPVGYAAAIEAADPSAEVVDGSPVWEDLVASPSEYDVEMIRHAGTVADEGLATAIATCRTGVSEYEVGLNALSRMASLGAEFPHGSPGPTLIGIGAASESDANMSPFYFTGNRLESGQLFWIDVIVCYNGYYLDCDRTVSIGRPTSDQQRIVEIVEEMYAAMFDTLAPGVTGHTVWKAGYDVAHDHGLGENMNAIYLGHTTGIGLSVRPYIEEGESEPIKPGSFVNIEPGIHVPNVGFACIENTVFVGESEKWTVNETDDGLHVV